MHRRLRSARHLLARSLCGVGLHLPRFFRLQIRFLCFLWIIRADLRVPPFQERLQTRLRFQLRAAGPGFRWRAAPVRAHQSHRRAIQGFVQVASEEVSHCGKITDRVRRANHPRACQVFLRRFRRRLCHLEMPDQRIVRLGRLLRSPVCLRNDPFHVRLPTRKPNFANEHILHHGFCSAFLYRADLATFGRCRHRIQLDHPSTIIRSSGLFFLLTKCYMHRLTWPSPTPYSNLAIALKNGTIGKNGRKFYCPVSHKT